MLARALCPSPRSRGTVRRRGKRSPSPSATPSSRSAPNWRRGGKPPPLLQTAPPARILFPFAGEWTLTHNRWNRLFRINVLPHASFHACIIIADPSKAYLPPQWYPASHLIYAPTPPTDAFSLWTGRRWIPHRPHRCFLAPDTTCLCGPVTPVLVPGKRISDGRTTCMALNGAKTSVEDLNCALRALPYDEYTAEGLVSCGPCPGDYLVLILCVSLILCSWGPITLVTRFVPALAPILGIIHTDRVFFRRPHDSPRKHRPT